MSQSERERHPTRGTTEGAHRTQPETAAHPLSRLHTDPTVARVMFKRALQRRASRTEAQPSSDSVRATADAGIAGPGGPLPFQAQIQSSFGNHDVSGVSAHTGEAAGAANGALGSMAYATGNDVAFAGTPDLHTAAHEAAHVVQQRAGVQLKGGVGEAGDPYEVHADAVADKVVRGESAEGLLSTIGGAPSASITGGSAVQHKGLQFLGTPLDKDVPSGDPAPAYGEDKGEQRRYSVDQYVAMWEKEQGRKMTPEERTTIERGCIGITADNLQGGGDPLNFAEGTYGTFDQAYAQMKKKNAFLDSLALAAAVGGAASPLFPVLGLLIPKSRYVLFAKRFWSNQKDGDNSAHDPSAFKPDPKTGEVDMSSYKYKARPGFVNFDYGFWDDATQCFWHANHMKFKDAAKNAKDPEEVYQSTKDRFINGYGDENDFDRTVFCIAKAENYNPGLAAIAHRSAP